MNCCGISSAPDQFHQSVDLLHQMSFFFTQAANGWLWTYDVPFFAKSNQGPFAHPCRRILPQLTTGMAANCQ
jgi:hypothetical protein